MNADFPLIPNMDAGHQAWRVFCAWAFMTPVGAMLTLLLLACGVCALVWREKRWVGVLVDAVGCLFALWVLGSVLQCMGVPVMSGLHVLAAGLPGFLGAVGGFLTRLAATA